MIAVVDRFLTRGRVESDTHTVWLLILLEIIMMIKQRVAEPQTTLGSSQMHISTPVSMYMM